MPEGAEPQQIGTVAIVGVGLIGGSFAVAIRNQGFTGEILGVSSPSVLKKAVELGVISRGATLEQACAEADLLYLADKVDGIIEILRRVGPLARPGCLITDAGSTKQAIVNAALENVKQASFLGGHPMAGKELRGVENADPHLFSGRPYVLTGASRNVPLVTRFEALLQSLNVRIVRMSPEEHDAAVAFTSHLPQLLSTALASTLADEDFESLRNVVGPGLLDMTRLALSSPDLWTSILRTNSDQVRRALRVFIARLNSIESRLAYTAIEDDFMEAAALARKVRSDNLS